jgi:hypothetical protein
VQATPDGDGSRAPHRVPRGHGDDELPAHAAPPMKVAHFVYAFLLACSSAAACEWPPLAAIPDVIPEDVTGLLLDVRRYSDSLIEFTDCVQAELAAAGGDAAPKIQRSVLIWRNNRAIAELKAVTDLYAERVGPLVNLQLAEYLGGESRDCLIRSWIHKTGVVNDGAVIFFVRNQQAYLNVLEATCVGLERQGDFVPAPQRATTGVVGSTRVCDIDQIFPYREESTRREVGCGLGRFFLISEEQALQILTPQRGR